MGEICSMMLFCDSVSPELCSRTHVRTTVTYIRVCNSTQTPPVGTQSFIHEGEENGTGVA